MGTGVALPVLPPKETLLFFAENNRLLLESLCLRKVTEDQDLDRLVRVSSTIAGFIPPVYQPPDLGGALPA